MYTTGILDVSHWEYDGLHGRLAAALDAAKRDGIVAVIAKATQGRDYVDPSWRYWAKAIRDAGLLLGAYHFGSSSSPGDQQADWFLRHFVERGGEIDADLMVLDFENNGAATMTLDQARTWLHRVHGVTKRRATLYGDSSHLSQIRDPTDVLGEFPLWVAAYGEPQPKIPRAWKAWTLWQYTDGPYGPHDQRAWPRRAAGFPPHLDRSAFVGDATQLATYWRA